MTIEDLGKCKVCGKPILEYSLIDGIAYPCGHKQLSKKVVNKNKMTLKKLNNIIDEN